MSDSARFRFAVMTALKSALEKDAASLAVGMAHELALSLSRAVLLDVLATRAMVDYGCMPLRSGRIVRWYSGQLGAGIFSQDPPIPFERNKPITVRALPGIRLMAFVELSEDRGEPPLPPSVRHAHLGYGKERTYVMPFGEAPR